MGWHSFTHMAANASKSAVIESRVSLNERLVLEFILFHGESTVSDRIERGLRPTPSPFCLAGETCRNGEERRAQSCLAKWNA